MVDSNSTKPYRLIMIGTHRAGKSSLRVCWFHGRRDFSNISETFEGGPYTQSSLRCGTKLVKIEDHSGDPRYLAVQIHDAKAWDDVGTAVFFFDASKDVEPQFVYFQAVIHLLAKHSPDAKIIIFLHKADLIPDNVDKTMDSLHCQVKQCYKKVVKEGHELVHPFQFMATTVYDLEIAYNALSMMLQSIDDAFPPHWTGVLGRLADSTNSDQLLLVETENFVVLKSILLDEDNTFYPDNWMNSLPVLRDVYKKSKSKIGYERFSFEIPLLRKKGENIFFCALTKNIIVILINRDPSTMKLLMDINVRIARRYCEETKILKQLAPKKPEVEVVKKKEIPRPAGPYRLLMLGTHQSGKSSLRMSWFHGRTNFTNVTKTYEIGSYTCSHINFVSKVVTIEDHSGNPHYLAKQVLDPKVWKNVGTAVFFFDASKEFDSQFIYFQAVISLFAKCSPDAKIIIFLNKIDLIQNTVGSAMETIRRKIKECYENVIDEGYELVHRFQFMATTVCNTSISRKAMNIVLRSIQGAWPDGWIRVLGHLADSTSSDQVMLFETEHYVPLESINLNGENYFNPDDWQDRIPALKECYEKWKALEDAESHRMNYPGRNAKEMIFVRPMAEKTLVVFFTSEPGTTSLLVDMTSKLARMKCRQLLRMHLC